MTLLDRVSLAVLQKFDPETAHGLALKAVRAGLLPKRRPEGPARLRSSLGALALHNPLGLAAGFDKNAEALGNLALSGFGFLEIGTVTPRPQPGNPRPRLFRLTEDAAAINRFGFNNDGMEAVAHRLATAPKWLPIGVNLGANKDSPDRAADYVTLLRRFHGLASFFTVNVSSPNTERLRDLQGKAALAALLERVIETHEQLESAAIAKADFPEDTARRPVFLKIAPDLDLDELRDVADVALGIGVDGIIATNTTLSRDGLVSPRSSEAGGLSGQPLFDRSTAVLATLARLTEGRVPLVGVGGVGSAEQAYAKIRAGASAVQLYTALVYQGMGLVPRLLEDLDGLLARDGFNCVAEAVGTDPSADS